MKLSIIVPVYNVEKYVGQCLVSCLNQDLSEDDYEIIVVNDGTPDNSMVEVERYAKKHTNIRIVERENGGLSAARNTGLSVAKGDYVWFVDSDDRIENNSLNSVLSKAIDCDLDVLCFGLQLEYPDKTCQPYNIRHEDNGKIYNGYDFICKVNTPPAAWAAIFKRSFLVENELSFLEGILHEDQEFTPRAYCLAQRISYLDSPVYYYNQREGGIMKSSRNAKRSQDLLTVADSLFSFAQSYLLKGTPVYNTMIRRVYFCVTQSLAFYTSEAFALSEYQKRKYYPMDVSLCSGTMKWKLRLANLSLYLYTKIYSWLKQ